MKECDKLIEKIKANDAERSELIRKSVDMLAKSRSMSEMEKILLLSFCLLSPDERKIFHPLMEKELAEHENT